jgi:hypothetical protein
MKAELVDVDAPAWSAFLSGAKHDFYHLPAYVRLCAAQERGEPRALLVDDADRRMLLPLIVRDAPGGKRDATSPYGYPGPLVAGTDDPRFLHDALEAGIERLAADSIVSLFVRLHPLLNARPPEGIGTVVQHGETVTIDLSQSAEALWSQTMSGHRNEINRAQKKGYRAYFDDAWAQFETFKLLYTTTMQRVSAASYYFFTDAYFDALRRALEGNLHLCVVEIGGEVAAAGLFVETCGLVQYHLSGTNDAYTRDRPTKLMLHFVRAWAKQRGDERMHLGGGVGGADDSLFRFKAGFSKLRQPFFTLRIVVDPPAYARLVAERDRSWDPSVLDGFFPLYRKS